MMWCGREAELEALMRWVGGEGAPRLMVSGSPGIGKSALVRRVTDQLGAGAWYVDCAALASMAQLCVALSALGPAGTSARRLEELAGVLPPVVVLDHAEGLADGGVLGGLPAPTRWLIAAQRRVAGEEALWLMGLSEADALKLVGQPLTPGLLTYCGGSPLALRLVSRRLGVMSAAELEARLGAGVLWSGEASGSMAQIIKIAWDRLSERARRGWAACAVWGRACALEELEALCGEEAWEVLEELSGACLVERRDAGWHMAESLGQFVRREAPALWGEMWARRREVLCALALREGPRLRSAQEASAREALRARQVELMGLLDEPEAGAWQVELLHALSPLLAEQGRFEALRGYVARLARVPNAGRVSLDLHLYAALAQGMEGDVAGALVRLEALWPLVLEGEPVVQRRGWYTRGMLRQLGQEYEGAEEALERALALAEARSDALLEAQIWALRGNVAVRRQRDEEALRHYAEALGRALRVGVGSMVASIRGNRGALLLRADRVEEALIELEEVAAYDEASGRQRNLCVALGNIGAAYLCLGELERAAQVLERALSMGQRVVTTRRHQLVMRALVALARGEEAGGWLEEAGALPTAERGKEAQYQLTRVVYHLTRGEEALARGWLARYEEAPYVESTWAHGALAGALAGGQVEAPPLRFMPLEHVIWRLLGRRGEALRVARDGAAFRLGGGEVVTLGRSGAGRRLLAALAAQQAAEPGAWMSAWALFEAGWPEERGVPSSGLNRLYTAINRLRAAGLDAALETGPDGYRLRGEVACVEASAL